MKRILALFLAMFCLLSFSTGLAEEWYCSDCSITVAGNFCSECGQKKPSTSNGDVYDLCLDVDFEENSFFSTYDVDVYINSNKITTLGHGNDLYKTISVPKGTCTIAFYKEGDRSISGTASVNIEGETNFSCEIHAKKDKIVVDHISTDGGEVDTRIALGQKSEINGLEVTLLKTRTTTGSSYNKAESGNTYILCQFEISNCTNKTVGISSLLCFSAYCDDYTADVSFNAIIEANGSLDGDIAPGKKMKGEIGFEIPKDWEELEIVFTPELWSSDSLTFVVNNK